MHPPRAAASPAASARCCTRRGAPAGRRPGPRLHRLWLWPRGPGRAAPRQWPSARHAHRGMFLVRVGERAHLPRRPDPAAHARTDAGPRRCNALRFKVASRPVRQEQQPPGGEAEGQRSRQARVRPDERGAHAGVAGARERAPGGSPGGPRGSGEGGVAAAAAEPRKVREMPRFAAILSRPGARSGGLGSGIIAGAERPAYSYSCPGPWAHCEVS